MTDGSRGPGTHEPRILARAQQDGQITIATARDAIATQDPPTPSERGMGTRFLKKLVKEGWLEPAGAGVWVPTEKGRSGPYLRRKQQPKWVPAVSRDVTVNASAVGDPLREPVAAPEPAPVAAVPVLSDVERVRALMDRADAIRAAGGDVPAELDEALRLARAVHGADDWRVAVPAMFPSVCRAPFAPHHEELLGWADAIEEGSTPRPFVAIWNRGAAKSSIAELICVWLAHKRVRKYALYVSGKQAKADDHVQSIADLLESDEIATIDADLSERRIGKYGASKGWRRNRLTTKSGFTVDAVGLDSDVRGARIGTQRPDLLCHERGSVIVDGDWVGAVEDHPGVLGSRRADGLTVTVWGVAEPETVTCDHRFWVRDIHYRKNHQPDMGTAGWVTADALDAHHYIGTPIDTTIIDPPSVEIYEPGIGGIERDELGRVTCTRNGFRSTVPDEFMDPEWWWAFGLWWGDGHLSGNYTIGVTVSNTEPHIRQRLTQLLDKYAVGWSEIDKVGCTQIVFSNAWMQRWLRSWRYRIPNASAHGLKCPPRWVERIDPSYQAQLLRGYVDADGCAAPGETKIVTVSYRGVSAAQRMLARLGSAATVRLLRGAGSTTICGIPTNTKPTYDLRFSRGREVLGLDPLPGKPRYQFGRTYIADGYLWHKIRAVEPALDRAFVPVDVGGDHTYITPVGLSHNCFDDIDGIADSLATIDKKIDRLTKDLIPTRSPEGVAMMFVQNIIHGQSIAARLAEIEGAPEIDFMARRIVSGPIKAVDGLEVHEEYDEEIDRNRMIIVGGTPTWVGYDIPACQDMIDDEGLTAFLSECQHEYGTLKGGMFDHIDFSIRRRTRAELPALNGNATWKGPCGTWVDPAVTSTDRSDSCAVMTDGLGPDKKYWRLYSWEQVTSPEEAMRNGLESAMRWGSQVLGVETDQGGDTWEVVYRTVLKTQLDDPDSYTYRRHLEDNVPVPKYEERKAGAAEGSPSKRQRIAQMLARYDTDEFRHFDEGCRTLEAGLSRFPKYKPFDICDAAWHSFKWLAEHGGERSNTFRVRASRGSIGDTRPAY